MIFERGLFTEIDVYLKDDILICGVSTITLSFISLKTTGNWVLEVLVDRCIWKTVILSIVPDHYFPFCEYWHPVGNFTLHSFYLNSHGLGIYAIKDGNWHCHLSLDGSVEPKAFSASLSICFSHDFLFISLWNLILKISFWVREMRTFFIAAQRRSLLHWSLTVSFLRGIRWATSSHVMALRKRNPKIIIFNEHFSFCFQALQLVRAVATVLRLSKKDEFLIRQKLEERRSWFNTPVVAAKSSGQFAKMLPPSWPIELIPWITSWPLFRVCDQFYSVLCLTSYSLAFISMFLPFGFSLAVFYSTMNLWLFKRVYLYLFVAVCMLVDLPSG